jgi:uncharacterized membrane protein YsdA (DUF1294 family)
MKTFLIYFIVINAIGFSMMGADKQKSKLGLWRIPERTLLGVAIAGGSIGVLYGMNKFRHKTKKFKFSLGIPIIMFIQFVSILKMLFII